MTSIHMSPSFSMIFTENYVLVQFIAICPFLGVSKNFDSCIGMSGAVIFVMTLASAVTWTIYNFLLEPFGLTDVEFDLTPVLGYMRIDKGMTQWQAVERFCKIRYGSKLRISGSGKVYLKGFKSDKKVKFGGNGIKYYSIKENKCRHKLISEVKLKVSKTAGYLSTMKNPNPESEYVKRVRYVNASAENNTIGTADNIIERGNFDSRYIKLKFKGCVTDILGASAEIEDAVFGKLSGLTVRAISYDFSQNGEFTTVVLGENDREENV